MLTRVEVLPLSDNRCVCFQVEIRLALLYLAVYEHIRDSVDKHCVDTRILIFGTHCYESEVHNLRLFSKLKKL